MDLFNFLPPQASTMAFNVDLLYGFMWLITILFSILIVAGIVFFVIKYRRRSDAEVPAPIYGSAILEFTWSFIPFVLAMVMFFWGARLFITMTNAPKDAMEIYAIGKQWMWKIQHPTGQREINSLHVPVNKKVRMILSSEDVIHSFYIPAFRIKADAVPGRYRDMWFEATKVGTYHLFCAEYCGTEHAGMIGSVTVLSEADYQRWLSTGGTEAPKGTLSEQGQQIFTAQGCVSCHKADPKEKAIGPYLGGIYNKEVKLADGRSVVADASYIRESVYKPNAKVVAGYQAQMSTYEGLINEEDLVKIIAFIKDWKADGSTSKN